MQKLNKENIILKYFSLCVNLNHVTNDEESKRVSYEPIQLSFGYVLPNVFDLNQNLNDLSNKKRNI
jgi:hypothetical protein